MLLRFSANAYQFSYPLQIKVGLQGGPLQGAVHWSGEEMQSVVYTANSEQDVVSIDLEVNGKCDSANHDDGTCSDFVYIQVLPLGAKQAIAKKRLYVRVYPKVP